MKRILPLLTCLILFWSCAAENPAVRSEHGSMNNNHDIVSTQGPTEDELLDEALATLALPDETTENNQKAREILNNLIQLHPVGSRRPAAEALILLIDRQRVCMEKIKANRAGCSDVLSQKVRCEESENQCRQELTRILQENEQLKKDLQNLKNLEIELEQRNRIRR